MRHAGPGWLLAMIVTVMPAGISGQVPERRLGVFLDCRTFDCESDFFRTEIQAVNWVRDRVDGDVHVIMTSQETGAGREYLFDFIGTGPLEGRTDQLAHAASGTDTEAEILDALTATLALGLARFAHFLGAAGFEVTAEPVAPLAPDALQAFDDPWNYWIFEVGLSGSVSGEESFNERRVSGSFSANRTTELWKVRVDGFGRFERSETELTDSTYVNETTTWSVSSAVVRSVGDHWGLGGLADVDASTFVNRDLGFRVGPAAEWNYFPYEEATRRQLIVFYHLGLEHVRYEELTVYERTRETLFEQSLSVSYRVREPWGEAELAVEGAHFLNRPSLWFAEIDGELELRIVRGLTLNLEGSLAWIRNQVYLPAADISDEERLVQRRQLATGYDYRFEIGLGYEWGSIFNNVVNNRFPGQF